MNIKPVKFCALDMPSEFNYIFIGGNDKVTSDFCWLLTVMEQI